jgi:3-phenylpropionate/trans-cinnamate dioxygenase ferredoxin reductase subunit
MAGATAADTLRSRGFDGRLTLVGAESGLPYERPPISKEFLSGELEESELLVRPESFYVDNAIVLELGVRVDGVDVRAQTVSLVDGRSLYYDALLIATGVRGRQLAVPGASLEGVHSLRTIDDARRLKAELVHGRRALVVGMGFIGCEVTAVARSAGVDVVAIEPQAAPLAAALGSTVGALLTQLHRDQGVELILGEGVASFEGTTRVTGARLTSGRTIECDFAIVGVGTEAETALIEGTPIEAQNGILVDPSCRTNVERIYAAGDVARHAHPLAEAPMRIEHWQNAMKQGAHAAASMLGARDELADIPWFWSDQYDWNLQYTGFHEPWDDMVVRGSTDDGAFTAFYVREGRVRASLAVNRPKDARPAAKLIAAGGRVSRELLTDEATDLKLLAAGATP